ncbi:MAG: hypothetical protein K0S39_1050 [Paenibacillus sp.]|jgi:hypothetical protein|nr:hypothetical protein [Paenibacillus sp.]
MQINLDQQYIVCKRKFISEFDTTYGMQKYFCTRAEIKKGITVQEERRQGNFVQVSYIEGDKYLEPNYITGCGAKNFLHGIIV